MHLPYVTPLSFDGNNAGLPRVALLFLLFQHTLISTSFGFTYCTWREIRRYLLRNIASVPPSRHSYHTTILFRLRLVICSIHSVPLLMPLDMDKTYIIFVLLLAIHTMFFSPYHIPPTYLAFHYLFLPPPHPTVFYSNLTSSRHNSSTSNIRCVWELTI